MSSYQQQRQQPARESFSNNHQPSYPFNGDRNPPQHPHRREHPHGGAGGGAASAAEQEDYSKYQYPHNIQRPDHGTFYTPPNMKRGDVAYAPKPLDHFKRGHQERTDTRPKEYYSSKRGNVDPHHQQQQQHHQPPPPQQYRSEDPSRRHDHHQPPSYHDEPQHHGIADRRNDRDRYDGREYDRGGGGGGLGDAWASNRDRVTVVSGLEINPFLDQLERSHDISSTERMLDEARARYPDGFATGKAITALVSGCARRKNTRLAGTIWDWCKREDLELNTFHYNSMIAVAASDRKPQEAIKYLREMSDRGIAKNEVTFSSAITACEKVGDWRTALELLDSMEKEGVARTPISYNAAISACEKGMVPQKACEVFQRMKREGIRPSVVSYSALISAAEKGSQWKLALEILEDMKTDGFRGNVIAYSAAISALAKGQQWEKALDLFREIQACGKQPSIVTYNATMTALEKGLQWERALELFDEMKRTNLPITVVSYGSALSACDKGLQYRQCLEFLDEMTEMCIAKNVIIFGAAMSCMEKCCRADICFQLMERMKLEGVQPNVHIYNSVISACARNNLWEKGYELFREMDEVGVKRDVVTFNAVLDAVASQVQLGRMLFEEGVKQGFYARVSRLAKHWFELDLHFLSLGGGEIAMGWWFEVCLVPYLVNKCEKLKDVKSISIVTGYGKTRTRGRRVGDDGMRKRCRAMLSFMGIRELDQPNLGRLHIDMDSLLEAVENNGGTIIFDLESYVAWKERETTVNQVPDVPQKIRPRYRPEIPGSGRPPFVRIETESTSPEYRLENQKGEVYIKPIPAVAAPDQGYDNNGGRHRENRGEPHDDSRPVVSSAQDWGPDHRGSMRSQNGGRYRDDGDMNPYESKRAPTRGGFPSDHQIGRNDDRGADGRSYRRPSNVSDGASQGVHPVGGHGYDRDHRDGVGGTHGSNGRSEGWRDTNYSVRQDDRSGGHRGPPSRDGSGRYNGSPRGGANGLRDDDRSRSFVSHEHGHPGTRGYYNGERQFDNWSDQRKRSYVDSQERQYEPPQKKQYQTSQRRGYALEPES